MINLTPIDYLVHIKLQNNTHKRVEVEYKIICSNYKATNFRFFDSEEDNCAIEPNGYRERIWRPDYGIESLRNDIIYHGAINGTLTEDDIYALRADNYDVEIDYLNVIDLK